MKQPIYCNFRANPAFWNALSLPQELFKGRIFYQMVAQDESLAKNDYKSFSWDCEKIHTKFNENLARSCHGQSGRLTSHPLPSLSCERDKNNHESSIAKSYKWIKRSTVIRWCLANPSRISPTTSSACHNNSSSAWRCHSANQTRGQDPIRRVGGV